MRTLQNHEIENVSGGMGFVGMSACGIGALSGLYLYSQVNNLWWHYSALESRLGIVEANALATLDSTTTTTTTTTECTDPSSSTGVTGLDS